MLPAKGHFKEDPCPLFEEGRCDRPYCHYKHKRQEVSTELFNEYIVNLNKIIDTLPLKTEESIDFQVNSSATESASVEVVAVIDNVSAGNKTEPELTVSATNGNHEVIGEGKLPKKDSGELAKPENSQTDSSERLDDKINILSSINLETNTECPTSDLREVAAPESHNKKNYSNNTNNNSSDNSAKPSSGGTRKEPKLTKDQLRSIDEIVQLLKKVPERIDFIVSFLRTDEKTKSSSSSSSHRSKSHSSHSSKSHKSSHSDKKNEHKSSSSQHRKSSKSGKKDSSSRKPEKRKRESENKNNEVNDAKIARRENSTDKPVDNEIDSDACDDAVLGFNDALEVKEDGSAKKRLSVEEQLERIHDDDAGPSVSNKSSHGKRRIAHDTPYISDHTMLRAKVGKSTTITRPVDRVAAVAAPQETPATHESRVAALFGLNLNKPRIMAVPNAQRMLAEKSNIATTASRTNAHVPTISKTVSHGSKRVEHRVEGKDVLCPTVKEGSRQVGHTYRNLTLQRLFTAFSFLPTKNDAREMAIQEEAKIFRDTKDNLKRYNLQSVGAIMKAKRGYSKDKPTGPTEIEFYELVKPYLLAEEQLAENGFPVQLEEGFASCHLSSEFKYNKKYKHIKDAFSKGERYCIRCFKNYSVDETTWEQKQIPDVCVFHADNGKKKVSGEVTHKCCSYPGPGCTSESLHITDLNDYERFPDCVESQPKFPAEKYRRVLALDCEMVYTRLGVELAYIVVVDWTCSVVYEAYCKPSREVESYNTTYSGITEEKLRNVTKTLSTVQQDLLELISNETVLVGHSLDSDFRALHLVHSVVADTSYIYRVESPDGSFYKRRLKELAQSVLGKIIQESEYGHCAEEDANTAMALLRHKVLSM